MPHVLPRTILITGASSGIGAALALAYAAPGITLILTARHSGRLEMLAEQCRAKGAAVETGIVDVREKEALARFIKEKDAVYPVELVIANAGISAGFSQTAEENYQNADEVFAINLQGVLNTLHPVIPRMMERKRGQLAIISSLAGMRALPGAPAYSASKAAVRFYGDALRGELKPYGMHVSVICPGWIRTPLTDKNDFPMPLMMSVERAADKIIHSLRRKKARIAFPRRLYFALRLLESLPVFVSDPLFAVLPGKRHKS